MNFHFLVISICISMWYFMNCAKIWMSPITQVWVAMYMLMCCLVCYDYSCCFIVVHWWDKNKLLITFIKYIHTYQTTQYKLKLMRPFTDTHPDSYSFYIHSIKQYYYLYTLIKTHSVNLQSPLPSNSITRGGLRGVR